MTERGDAQEPTPRFTRRHAMELLGTAGVGAAAGQLWNAAPASAAPLDEAAAVQPAAVPPTEAVDASALDSSGGVVYGSLEVEAVPGTVDPDLPVGRGNSLTQTGIAIASTYPADDVPTGQDGTGRLSLYSYQRAHTNGYGETVRNFLMRKDAKAMTAWYMPSSGYDTDRDAVNGAWSAVAWTGAHYEADDHSGLHAHWELEIPDANGALQGRFEAPFADQTTGKIGVDKTNLMTNLADFTVRTHGTDTTGADIQQALRLSGPAGWEKPIEFGNTTDGTAKRWKIRATNGAESGSNAGTDLEVQRYNDAGTAIDQPLRIIRSTGQVAVGGLSGTSAGLTVTRASTSPAVTVTSTTANGQAVLAVTADSASAAYQARMSSDTINRFRIGADGRMEWGSGTATRDVTLYRSSADTLRTDDSLRVDGNVYLSTTSLGGGSGVIAVANAKVVPNAAPSGGGVLFVQNGALKYVGSSGTVTTIAPA
ncbi:hypothetical protein [Actinacidiphila paucisporea]|uniref:Uncharacterized protein n=1 Tax=Actinacidiphila paucisporea TaxID=310782 RepID=A0A1M7QF14_9ACTN|nr:hypothetical protein [Actinacidiphila paucisporea]SHN29148.1 hypothetical protein SAMN05216499_13314 [Actinacidiphila paucisporea]